MATEGARALDALRRPVDGASLAAFRVLFGLLMAAAMIRFAAKGWIRELYLDPTYHFSYWGMDWIRPPGTWGTYALFAGIGISALGIAAGRRARLWAALFVSLFTYVELIDQTTYLETAPADALDRMLFIEAERMANGLYHSDDVESERTVDES